MLIIETQRDLMQELAKGEARVRLGIPKMTAALCARGSTSGSRTPKRMAYRLCAQFKSYFQVEFASIADEFISTEFGKFAM
jgi:hypothetical protein